MECKGGLILVAISSVVISIQAFQLTVVHTNDVHARIEEASDSGGSCNNASKVAGRCFAGVARRFTKIRELNNTYPNLILLDAGDQYQGTQWFNVYKGWATAHFMNRLGYDAMALGNHEFDLGVSGLLPLLLNASFPILSANIDASQEPSVDGLFYPSTVLTVGGERIGVIGYTIVETPVISNPGNLKFKDEVEAIQPIADRMTQDGITKIIALGHSGYDTDKEMATRLRNVDIIVGGHSNTFLYTGTPPTNDGVIGPYPTVVTNPDGDKVLIVHDFFFGKFLGFLNVDFTPEGKVNSWDGNPILLNSSVPQDPQILAEVDHFGEAVINFTKVVIGLNKVYLEGDRKVCRLEECNLGNLITDSMIWNMAQSEAPNGAWTSAAIAVWNSGGIRSPIAQGEITKGDVLTVLPFENDVELVHITGRALMDALENSVSRYDPQEPNGRFLQVSGLQIVYDLRRPIGERLVDVRARSQRCDDDTCMPIFEPVKAEESYTVALSDFLINGDGYDFRQANRSYRGDLDSDLFTRFIRHQSPLYASVEGRIRFCDQDDSIYCPQDLQASSSPALRSSTLGILMLLLATLLRLLTV